MIASVICHRLHRIKEKKMEIFGPVCPLFFSFLFLSLSPRLFASLPISFVSDYQFGSLFGFFSIGLVTNSCRFLSFQFSSDQLPCSITPPPPPPPPSSLLPHSHFICFEFASPVSIAAAFISVTCLVWRQHNKQTKKKWHLSFRCFIPRGQILQTTIQMTQICIWI